MFNVLRAHYHYRQQSPVNITEKCCHNVEHVTFFRVKVNHKLMLACPLPTYTIVQWHVNRGLQGNLQGNLTD